MASEVLCLVIFDSFMFVDDCNNKDHFTLLQTNDYMSRKKTLQLAQSVLW